jgi:branched-chain amino acid transport system ATP-binding protein
VTVVDEEPRLQARGVTVRFGGVVALSDVALSVPGNTIVGLVGPNGAGKSTLLGVLSGTIRGSGQIMLDGVDVTNMRSWVGCPRALRKSGPLPKFSSCWVSMRLVIDRL